MAWEIILRVGDTSTYDVRLTTLPCMVTEYPLASPITNQETIQSLGDGNSLSVPTWANVTESIDLHIGGSGYTSTDVADVVHRIERNIDLARQGWLGASGEKVYLLIRFDHDSEWWRSQILAAQWSSPTAVERIHKNYAVGTLAITRRYFWETELLATVAVSSGTTTTPTTGYATVYNADDTHATQRNWFQIASTEVTGSLPAPAKISVKNISGATRGATEVYLGNYVFCNPTTVDPIFRHEDAAGAFTTVTTSESGMYNWRLTGLNLVDDFHGQFGRFVAVFSNPPQVTTLLRAMISWNDGVAPLAYGEHMLGQYYPHVQDLGALPIPPSMWSSGMGHQISLHIRGKTATGTDTVAVDWLQIFPSGGGRYRVLQALTAWSLGTDDEVIDDGTVGAVYSVEAGEKLPVYRPLYDPIHLWPGLTQRLRLIVHSGGDFEAGQPWGVSVSYRPRRITL